MPPPPYDTLFDPDYEGTVTGEGFFFGTVDPGYTTHRVQTLMRASLTRSRPRRIRAGRKRGAPA